VVKSGYCEAHRKAKIWGKSMKAYWGIAVFAVLLAAGCGKEQAEGSASSQQEGEENAAAVKLRNDPNYHVLVSESGTRYEGTFTEGTATEGSGVFVVRTTPTDGAAGRIGFKYVGGFLGSKFHGDGTMDYSAGRTKRSSFEGEFRNGMQHYGTLRFDSGAKYVGPFKDEKYSGHGLLVEPDGTVFEGEFRNGMQHFGRLNFGSGDKYVGEFKDNKYSGHGVFIAANGTTQIGSWSEGEYVGEATSDMPERVEAAAVEARRKQEAIAVEATREQEIEEMHASAVSASVLQSEYEANELRADDKYLGKRIFVKGSVKSVEKFGGMGRTGYKVSLNASTWFDVVCYLRASAREHAVELNKGEHALLECSVKGGGGNVYLEDCVFP
jgi:hypothetical protein